MVALEKTFLTAVESGASDIHLTASSPALMRVNGELVALGDHPLAPADTEAALASLLQDAELLASFVGDGEVDFSWTLSGVARFRINAFRQRGSVALVCRRIPASTPSLDQLGLAPAVRELGRADRGLVLISGATGSGKSTTLAAIIDQINSSQAKHIVTIEDPIEFVYSNRRAVINQREVGADTASFKRALKRVLRQDPDVIAIGEMRDEETVESACYAARTGHLVLSTVHASDALDTVERIIDLFPQGQAQQVRAMLASTLRGVIVQRLVPTADGRGRVAACEVLVNTPRVRDMLLDPEMSGEIPKAIVEGEYYGMQSFDQCLLGLHQRGVISLDDALRAATNPNEVKLQAVGSAAPAVTTTPAATSV